jgi:AcrR family transcriptional regulator
MNAIPARRRNRRGEGARLRAEILQAASELIEKTGNEQSVSLREVARRVGIAAPSIYEHFADRDAIIDAVFDTAFASLHETLAAAVNSETDPCARLSAGCCAYLRFAEEHPNQYRVMWLYQARILALPAGHPTITLRFGVFELLVTAVAQCADAQHYDRTEIREQAKIIFAALHGYATLRPALPRFGWMTPEAAVTRILASYTPV